MEAVKLRLDETVDVREEGGRIVVEPVRSPKVYDLAQLLAGITPENLHAEVDFGPAVGKEAF
jgi:antitoxin MazE